MSARVRTLAELFPQLPFSLDADAWLASLSVKSLAWQLRERRIVAVKQKKLIFAGIARSKDGNFEVWFPERSGIQYRVQSLGHEIGHTFQYDLSASSPTDCFAWIYRTETRAARKLYRAIELFCDSFGKRWLKHNGRDRVTRAIENSLRCMHLCYIPELGESVSVE